MKVTQIDCHVLLDPSFDLEATSACQDALVVEIHTDEGITGIGESEVNPWIGRACIEAPGTHSMGRGLTEMLVGLDPTDPPAVWEQLYVGSIFSGRRGALICALGAIDLALWDIAGKAAGVPCYELLGGAVRTSLSPYASLQPETGADFDGYLSSMVEWVRLAKVTGFTAAKLEATLSGPYAHQGLNEPDERTTEIVAACREAAGDDFILMVDVQYAFDSVERALRTIESWVPYDVYFVETPLRSDDLDAYAELSRVSPIPVAAGEFLTTRHEFVDLIDRGQVEVLQPSVTRVGGLTEAQCVCRFAAERGRQVVPHAWHTGITVAATAHLQAATPNMPYFEFLTPELSEPVLRKMLVDDEVKLVGGEMSLPSKPGLGIELNREALEFFARAAEDAFGTGAIRRRAT